MSDYNAAEKLVMIYKETKTQESAENLLETFKGFVNKFSFMINSNVIDLSNRSTRGFINMFIKDFKGNMHLVGHSLKGMERASDAVALFSNMFTSKYEKEEIENMAALALLICADKYRSFDENPRFHTYLLKCYHFRLYELLMKDIKDSLNLAMLEYNYDPIHNNHYETAECDRYDLNDYSKALKVLKTESDTCVDDNWVMGITGDLLLAYTSLEKKILKLKYVDNFTDGEIAELMSVSRSFINEKRLALEGKIKKCLTSTKVLRE